MTELYIHNYLIHIMKFIIALIQKKNNAIFDRINYLVSVKSDDKLTHIILCLH